jgi:ABC-type transport system involved in cytochrome c biogenesis permease subunit
MIDLIISLSFSFLTFLVLYGLLNKIKLFERGVNFVISIIISFFVLFTFEYYHGVISRLFSIFSLVILLVFIILSFFFSKKKQTL